MTKDFILKLLIFISIFLNFNILDFANAEVDNIIFDSSGLIDQNNLGWLYAGKIMYDSQENLFKYWGCAGIGSNNPGDHIVYKQSSTYSGLTNAPFQVAFGPSRNSSKFDKDHTCDPSVIEHEGLFYLHYTGLNQQNNPNAIGPSKLGVAISYNRGRTFERLFNGQPIRTPTVEDPYVYGAGQSSVTKGDDGYFYMLYTDRYVQNGIVNQYVRFLRSPLPTFPIGNLATLVASHAAHLVGGASLELIFNRGRGRLEVVGNNYDPEILDPNHDPNSLNNYIILTHLDRSLSILGQTNYDYSSASYTHGEGIATLTNTIGEPIPYMFSGRMHWNFVATTWDYTINPIDDITGPVMFTRFTEGVNGTLTDFSQDGDKKLGGDLDGDGVGDTIVIIPNSLTFKWKLSSQGFSQVHTQQWGLNNDIPIIVKDWNNDGKDEIAVFRPSNGRWYILITPGVWPNLLYQEVPWGLNGDMPLSGDTNGNGKGELVVWRKTTGDWFILRSGIWGNGDYSVINWGINGDNPFISDLNGDSKDDLLIWRPGNSTAYPLYN